MSTSQNPESTEIEIDRRMFRRTRSIAAIDQYLAFCESTESADEFAAMMIAARDSDLI